MENNRSSKRKKERKKLNNEQTNEWKDWREKGKEDSNKKKCVAIQSFEIQHTDTGSNAFISYPFQLSFCIVTIPFKNLIG